MLRYRRSQVNGLPRRQCRCSCASSRPGMPSMGRTCTLTAGHQASSQFARCLGATLTGGGGDSSTANSPTFVAGTGAQTATVVSGVALAPSSAIVIHDFAALDSAALPEMCGARTGQDNAHDRRPAGCRHPEQRNGQSAGAARLRTKWRPLPGRHWHVSRVERNAARIRRDMWVRSRTRSHLALG